MDVTVALCTRNRAEQLAATLASLEAARVPAGVSWEVVVVDNASTDATPEVLARRWELPLKALHEPRDGKSRAANRATEAARGALLLWTDDDVRVDPGWIEAYLDAARRRPDAAWFGGPVRPWFETEPPRWLGAGLHQVALAYAILDLGPEERALRPGERANGPNWALRADAARAHPWNPELGPRANGRIPGGETWVQSSMERAGLGAAWIPAARVDHFIPQRVMTLDHVRYRYRLHGRAQMRGGGRALRAADAFVSLVFDAAPRYALQRLFGAPPERWIRNFRRCQEHLGRLRGVAR